MARLLVALASLVAAPLASATPPASEVWIEGFAHQGDGCPAGSTASILSPDLQALTVLFDRYHVEGGTQSAARREEVLRTCAMTLRLRVPAGWQFAVHEVHYRGFASLTARTAGRQSSTYRWGAAEEFRPLAFIRLDGPYEGDYQSVGRAQGVSWSPCRPRVAHSPTLFVRSHIGVKGILGYMTVDSFDHQIREQYRIAWRPCR